MAKLVLNQHLCPICGGILKSIGNNEYKCEYCGKGPYTYEKVEEDFLESVSAAIDQVFYNIKNEQLANLRHRLYELTKIDKYCNSNAIKNVCEDIKKIVPADFFANFYLVANSGIKTSVNEFIDQIDIEKEYEKLEWAVEFMLRSLQSDNITSMSRLLEKAKLYAEQRNIDDKTWIKLVNKFETEVSRINNGIYDVDLPRDVFVAYSSKDIDLAYQIVNVLEANDMSCFIAARNLQNGSNAVNNYQSNIQKAIDNSTVFLFVSTNNSRSKSCDAYDIEMQYIMNSELLRLGNITHKVYEKLGKESNKKPRIEFLADKYTGTTIYEDNIKSFFKGYTYCKDVKSLPKMVYTAIQEKETTDWGKTQTSTHNQEVVKEIIEEKTIIICPDCGTKNSDDAKFCSNCGRNFSANTIKEGIVGQDKKLSSDMQFNVNINSLEKLSVEELKKLANKNLDAMVVLADKYLDLEKPRRQDAFELYCLAGEKGHIRALNSIGYCYELGYGVGVDIKKAASYYLRSAELGYANAQVNIGLCYENGLGVEQNYENALFWYKKSAEQDNARGLYLLGLAYYYGDIIEEDEKLAFKYFLKAAEMGFVKAERLLADCYYDGSGVDKNRTIAFNWYKKAADKGDASALKSLADYYREGYEDRDFIVKKDIQKAFEYYSKSAKQGDDEAQFIVGLYYINGELFPKDKIEAFKWFKKSAEQENVNAQFNVGLMYENGDCGIQDMKEAFNWYKKAAEQGHVKAQFYISIFYGKGIGVAIDKQACLKWLQTAAENGHGEAQFNLGNLFYKGEIVKQDINTALKWYNTAAANGHERAQLKLGKCFLLGDGVEKNIDQATNWFKNAAEQGNIEAKYKLKRITMPTSPLQDFVIKNGVLEQYLGHDTEVVIPEGVKKIGAFAFNRSDIKEIILPETITDIEYSVFSGCISMKNIFIPSSVINIDIDAFEGCDALTEISVSTENSKYKSLEGNLYSRSGRILLRYAPGKEDKIFNIPQGVTSIGFKAFDSRKHLSEINIPNSVTLINSFAFAGCSINTLVLPDNLNEIGCGLFNDDDNVKFNVYDNGKYLGSKNNPYFALVDVTSKEMTSLQIHKNTKLISSELLDGNYEIDSIYIPKNVEYISKRAFLCKHLSSITVDPDNKNFKSIDGNLYSKDGKKFIQYALGKYDFYFSIDKVESIEDFAFSRCALTDLNIGDSVTHISKYAFTDCCDLMNVTIPERFSDDIKTLFNNSTKAVFHLYKFVVTDENGATHEDLSRLSKKNIANHEMKSALTNNGSINLNDFEIDRNGTLIKYKGEGGDVVLPNCIKNIDKDAFYFYKNKIKITSLTIPSSVIKIRGSAFTGSEFEYVNYLGTLESWCMISFEEGLLSNPLSYTKRFYIDNKLIDKLIIPKNVTVINDSAFSGDVFKSIIIPSHVKSIGYGAFSGCKSLSSLIIEDGVINIDDYAFSACDSLKTVSIPNSVKKIGEGAFNGRSLVSFIVSDNHKYLSTINGHLYNKNKTTLIRVAIGCSDMVFTVPNTVNTIAPLAFESANMTDIIMHKNVKKIGRAAFYGCYNIKNVTISKHFKGKLDKYFNGAQGINFTFI